jgi:hypothetical protein
LLYGLCAKAFIFFVIYQCTGCYNLKINQTSTQ